MGKASRVAGDGQLLLLGFVLAWQPAGADKMFRVAANMNETYYGEDVQQRKSNLVSPIFWTTRKLP